jgi:DNA topoisomerase-1
LIKITEGNIVRKCQLCNDGTLSLKNSFRGGAFIGCSNYPECKFTRPLSKAKAAAQAQLAEPKFIGKHENGNDIYLKNGRFGPYLQYEKILDEIENENNYKEKEKKVKKVNQKSVNY